MERLDELAKTHFNERLDALAKTHFNERLDALAKTRFNERLDALAKMRETWSPEDGESPTDDAIAAARAFIGQLMSDDPLLQRFGLYPNDEGGVIAEWLFEYHSADLSFARDGITVVLGKTIFKEPPIPPKTLHVAQIQTSDVSIYLRGGYNDKG